MRFSSIYLHFPFCETKCHYCDFYSLAAKRTTDQQKLNFYSALGTEIEIQANQLSENLETIFFGGGTPSMTDPETIEKMIGPIRKQTSRETEWTSEVNPSSVDLQRLKKLKHLGINRISMGVQSLVDAELKLMGRVHDSKSAIQALENIFLSGIKNVSVDLLCGLPDQSIQSLENSINQLMKFPITHISIYLLTLPEKHWLYPKLPNEQVQMEHLLFIDKKIKSLGWEHYEVSNFCKPGFQAEHNLAYWKGESYLGFGPSAHSFNSNEKKRWKNISSLKKYSDSLDNRILPIEWTENLKPEQLELEKWMLGLRLSEGVPSNWITTQEMKIAKEKLLNDELLVENKNRVFLTPKGFTLSDYVIASLATA